MHNVYDNTPESIKKAYEQLSGVLDSNGILDAGISYAAEHMIDDNFEHLLESEQIMPLNKQYLLVEMSYLQPSFNFDFATEKITKQQYFPILAHPERYMYFHGKYGVYESMKSKGILFQLNLQSLTPKAYGPDATKIAHKLLNDRLIDFIGTDVHNLRQLGLLKEVRISKKVLNQLLPVIERTIQSFY
jgi:protein-tyrosine phosphatase